jgi:hypothetical protein
VPTPWDAIASPPAGAGPAAGAEVVTPAQDGNAERHRELAEHATQVRRLADELAAAIAKGLVLGLPIPGRVHGAWLAVDEWAELLGRSQRRTDQPRGPRPMLPTPPAKDGLKGELDVAAQGDG